MVSRWFFCFCLLLSPLASAQLAVEASVNRNPVAEGDSFVLEVVANEEIDNDALDPAPLLKQFIVGQVRVSRQTRIINFDTSKKTTWRIPLVARHTGMLTIPALTVAGVQTRPIELQVLPASAAAGARQQEIMLKMQADKPEIYPGEQLLVSVDLYLAVDLRQGNLSAPTLAAASIRQIGSDQDDTRLVNGRRYRVITRRYSVTVDQPGSYQLQGPVFQGEIIAPAGGDPFTRGTTPVLQRGDDLQVEVLPRPADYQGNWLPAEQVSLHQEWQPTPEAWRVGEPVTRTITLTAIGVGKDTLPLLSLTYPDGLRVYPDQQQASEFVQQNKLLAQLQLSQAVIPNQDGSVTLPALRVPWWDVVQHQQRWAELPEQTIQVAAAQGLPSPAIPSPSPQAPAATGSGISPWWLVLPSVGWLLTAGLWAWHGYRSRRQRSTAEPRAQAANAHWPQLQQACRRHQADSAYAHFCRWRHTSAAAGLDPQRLQQLTRQLEAACFSPRPGHWDGNAFLAELTRLRRHATRREIPDPLPSLNP